MNNMDELYKKMEDEAEELFYDPFAERPDQAYYDELCFRIANWANESENNRQSVIEHFSLEEYELEEDSDLLDALRGEELADFFAISKIADFAAANGIPAPKPYVVYFQNEDAYAYTGDRELCEGMEELMKNSSNTNEAVVIYGLDGVEMKGVLNNDFVKDVKDKYGVDTKESKKQIDTER